MWRYFTCAISLNIAISTDVWVCVLVSDTHRPQWIGVLTVKKVMKAHTWDSLGDFGEITFAVLVSIGSLSGGHGGEIFKIYLHLTISIYCQLN